MVKQHQNPEFQVIRQEVTNVTFFVASGNNGVQSAGLKLDKGSVSGWF